MVLGQDARLPCFYRGDPGEQVGQVAWATVDAGRGGGELALLNSKSGLRELSLRGPRRNSRRCGTLGWCGAAAQQCRLTGGTVASAPSLPEASRQGSSRVLEVRPVARRQNLRPWVLEGRPEAGECRDEWDRVEQRKRWGPVELRELHLAHPTLLIQKFFSGDPRA